MATKKTTKDKKVQESASVQPAEVVAAPEDHVCIRCRFIRTGDWRGPTCMNPASSFYRKHMSDYGTCAEFSLKGKPLVVVPEAEGLYDPEPGTRNLPVDKDTSLEDMLEKETTPSDEQ